MDSTTPTLEGRRTRLRIPTQKDHLGWSASRVYQFGSDSEGDRGVPHPTIRELGLRNLFARFVIESRATSESVGFVSAYRADLVNGHCYVALTLDTEARHLGWPLEALPLFVDYLFDIAPFRKVYGEVRNVVSSAPHLLGLRRIARQEGCLVEYASDGSDLLIFGISRARWQDFKRDPVGAAQRALVEPKTEIDAAPRVARPIRTVDLGLTEVLPEESQILQQLATSERGRCWNTLWTQIPPTPADFLPSVAARVASWLALRTSTGLTGFATLHDIDSRGCRAWISLLPLSDGAVAEWVRDALTLVVKYGREAMDVDHLLFEASGPGLATLVTELSEDWALEAQMEEHVYFSGGYWPTGIFSNRGG